MVSALARTALAFLGVLVVVAAGVALLPGTDVTFEAHQVDLPCPEEAAPIDMDCIAAGQPIRVRIYPPATPATTLVELRLDGPLATINVLGNTYASGPATSIIGVSGNVLTDDVVDFTLHVAGTPHLVSVDRATYPATIRVDGSNVISGPFFWKGDALNPTEFAVYDDKTGTTPRLLFRYRFLANDTAELTLADGTQRWAPRDLVTVSGSPADPWLRVDVRNDLGAPEHQVIVPLGWVRESARTGTPLDSYITVAHNALPGMPSHKLATDGERTFGPPNLTGNRFLDGDLALRIGVDVRKADATAAPPTLLLDTRVPDPVSSPRVGMAPVRESAGYVRYEAAVPPAWKANLSDGDTVYFAFAHRLTVLNSLTETLLDDNYGAGYRFRVDRETPSQARVEVTAPEASKPWQLWVKWNATDDASGVASYRVEKGLVEGDQVQSWSVWNEKATATGAAFTGEPGETWRFRVNATDAVGRVGPLGASADHAIPGDGGSGTLNRAPEVQLLQPTGGESFVGVGSVLVKWRASDPDGTVPVINLYWSADGGATWTPLATPSGAEHVWDVASLAPGSDYRLKVEATDGSASNQDVSARFTIDSTGVATAETLGGPGGQSSLPPPGDEGPALPGEEGREPQGGPAAGLGAGATQMSLLAALLLAAGIGVVVWQWRLRRL